MYYTQKKFNILHNTQFFTYTMYALYCYLKGKNKNKKGGTKHKFLVPFFVYLMREVSYSRDLKGSGNRGRNMYHKHEDLLHMML